MSNDTRIAVDVAKAVFEVAISDQPGHVTRERLPRTLLLTFMAQQPAAIVVMEACGSAHHWGRKIRELGHRIVLLPPHYVRPYVRGNKTDRTDAKGILDASRNADIRPVPVKTVDQQVLTLASSPALGVDDRAHGATQCVARSSSRAGHLHSDGCA
jgi:transposase